ncbi:MAG: site-specific integrase [Chitinophagaceae bacterium]
MNASVKVILYKSKKLSNGEFPVMLRIIKDRKPKYLSTGVSSTEELWDFANNIPKRKHPHFKEIKIKLRKKLLEAEKYVLDLDNDDKNLSAHEIRGGLKRKKASNPLLYDFFDIVIKRLQNTGQIKNSEIYKDAKRNLLHFTQGKTMHFSDVDIAFLNQFEEFLKTKGKGSNTIYLYLRTLRALMNKAIKEEYCAEKYYPFKRFSLTKYAKIKTEKRAISKADIEKIKAKELKDEKLEFARDIFLFSYYCRGMNFTDIAALKWEHIYNGRLTYVRQKTKERFNIELLEPAIEILNKYKEDKSIQKNEYVFPILNHSHKSPKSIYNRKVKILRSINKDLKKVAEKAEVDAHLTTYVARHSYATVLKKTGISTKIISEAMGHDSEKTTQIYLEGFENSVLDEASKAIL